MSALGNEVRKGPDETTLRALTFYSNSDLLSEQLPITLKNGFEVTELSTECPRCESTIPEDCTRGTISQAFGGILIFHSVGLCRKCNACVLFNGRVKPEGRTFALETIQQGQWVRFKAQSSKSDQLWYWLREKIQKVLSI